MVLTTTTDKLEEIRAMAKEMVRCQRSPYRFVMFAFPWGKAGTELADHDGPYEWQAGILKRVGRLLREGHEEYGVIQSAILEAVSSGHGIGKSALIAWLMLWSLSTFEDTKGVVTANTESQLRTKTWPELKKWHRLAINSKWFTCAGTSIHSVDREHSATWRIDAIPWNETRPEAFAGLHNAGRRIVVFFDEASAIPDVIWETVEGALTDENTEILWFAFGNPTRTDGRFRECFGKFRHRWSHQHIDARDVPGTNKKQIEQWAEDYGDDSDFFRVRVRGVFPRASATQLIPSDIVDAARKAEAVAHLDEPLIVGADIARYGDDETKFRARRGRDARTWGKRSYRGLDTMQTAARLIEFCNEVGADMAFIDDGGVGGGVVDRCRQLGLRCIGVNFGSKADYAIATELGLEGEKYSNKRSEMWGSLRGWLRSGAAIEDDDDLATDLTGPEYGFNVRNEIQLEKKEDMKKRGLASPDDGDALALTFAYPVAGSRMEREAVGADKVSSDWDPMGDA